MDSLPDYNLAEYLKVVQRHTSYNWNIVLYADYGIDDELSKRLDQRGVSPRLIIPTAQRRCGDQLLLVPKGRYSQALERSEPAVSGIVVYALTEKV